MNRSTFISSLTVYPGSQKEHWTENQGSWVLAASLSLRQKGSSRSLLGLRCLSSEMSWLGQLIISTVCLGLCLRCSGALRMCASCFKAAFFKALFPDWQHHGPVRNASWRASPCTCSIRTSDGPQQCVFTGLREILTHRRVWGALVQVLNKRNKGQFLFLRILWFSTFQISSCLASF